MNSRRLARMMLVFLIGASLLLIRAAHLQIVGDERLSSLGKRQFESKVLLRPKRGPIYDRNGDLLATNDEVRSLAADPSRVRDRSRTASRLARALGQSAGEIEAKLRSNSRFVWIRRHLPSGVADRLRNLDEGVWLIEESLRVYPHGHLAGQLLGSVNLDSEGLEGVELFKNADLSGQVVSVRAIKDAMGRPSFIDAKAAQEVKHGSPVRLTLDAGLQADVEQKLEAAVLKHGARSGLALVMHAGSGELLSLAHYPFFDPRGRSAAPDLRRIRAWTDGYEPGSVLKPFLMAAALKAGVKGSDHEWGGRGEVYIQGKRIGEAEEHEKFEWLTLAETVKLSSNVGAAKFALRIGAPKYFGFLREFGFGSRSGLGMPGEISGVLPPADQVKPLRLANIGFGQGLLATPLQVARAMAGLLGHGNLPTPRLFLESEPQLESRLSPAISASVLASLAAVVEDEKGTGRKAQLPGYRVVGKTATAQVVDPRTRKYSTRRYISSFTGGLIAPKDSWVILALLDGASPHYYAGDVAAPLFRSIAESVAVRLGVVPEPPVNGVSASAKPVRDRVVTTAARAVAPVHLMPDLVGLGARQAIQELSTRGVQVHLEGFGAVREQIPAAGTPLVDGQVARVVLKE